MRIALLAWESMHSIAVGGLAAHVTELAAALRRSGHDVHLFTRTGPGQSRYDCIEGVHYHRCPFDPHTSDFTEYVRRMCDSFVHHLGEVEGTMQHPFDIVHGHDWLSVPAMVRIKNELRHRVVFTIHSTEYGRCGNEMRGGQSENIRHQEWEGAYIANRVICVSKTLRNEVNQLYGVPVDKIQAIYNGVDASKFDADIDVNSVRQRHDIAPQDPTVLFAGRLTWQKGPDLLVDAMPGILKKHPETKFIFAGEGDMRKGLEARTSQLGTARSTRFVGHRNGLDLIGLFKSADAVCVPSRNEPFGIVILEAWSAGKPVVVTRNGGPAEFVSHHNTGITVSADRDAIGSGVNAMLEQMDQARGMGRKGRLQAETLFSWNHIASETEQVYRSARDDEPLHTPSPATQESMLMAKSKLKKEDASRKAARPRGGKTTSTKTRGNGTLAVQTAQDVTEEMIRQRAHEIWLERDCAPGDPASDWLQAERELRGEIQAPRAAED